MKSKNRLSSFIAAFSGLFRAIKQERNFQIHLAITVVVLASALFFRISTSEWLIILFCISTVLVAELLNTAIERCVDYISLDYSEQAKTIKDFAAAAVLVSALCSALIASIIFYPKCSALLLG